MKRFLCILCACVMSLSLVQCQTSENGEYLNKPTPRNVVRNYLFTHGMCLGYLNDSSVTKEQFALLVQYDQTAKLRVAQALANPNLDNLNEAKKAIEQLIGYISTSKNQG